MRDERFKGHQNFSFEACLQDDGQRVFGGKANAGVPINVAIDRDPRGTRGRTARNCPRILLGDPSDQIVEVHALSCFSSVCCVL